MELDQAVQRQQVAKCKLSPRNIIINFTSTSMSPLSGNRLLGDRWKSDRGRSEDIFLRSQQHQFARSSVVRLEKHHNHQDILQKKMGKVSGSIDNNNNNKNCQSLGGNMSNSSTDLSATVCLKTQRRTTTMLMQLILLMSLLLAATFSQSQAAHSGSGNVAPTSGGINVVERKVSNLSEQQQLVMSKQNKPAQSSTSPNNHLNRLDSDQFIDTIQKPNEELALRHKRQTSDLEPSQRPLSDASLWPARHPTLPQARRIAAPAFTQDLAPMDCKSMEMFWNFFRQTYPNLASHLYSIARAPETGEQHLIGKLVSKGVAALLSQADRLLLEQLTMSSSKPELRDSANNPWLTRVLTNPIYSRLIQHLKKWRHHMRPQSANALTKEHIPQSVTTDAQPLLSRTTEAPVYGRVINYPSEKTPEGTKTINKIHKLSQLSNEELESNKITPNREESISPEDHGAARSKFVYGTVHWTPDEMTRGERESSYNNLKQLNINLNQANEADGAKQESRNERTQSEPSYGRVFLSPPNALGAEGTRKAHNNSQSRWLLNKETLEKLRQQLEGRNSNEQLDGVKGEREPFNPYLAGQLADEFEGEFHSDPISQIEVRELRNNGDITHTTSKEFMLDKTALD